MCPPGGAAPWSEAKDARNQGDEGNTARRIPSPSTHLPWLLWLPWLRTEPRSLTETAFSHRLGGWWWTVASEEWMRANPGVL